MSERRNPKSSIGDPVLLQNKAFLPCHTKTELRRYTIAQDQATDNVIVSLAKEAAADKMTQESIQSSYETVSNQRTRKKRGLSALFLLINLVILAGIFLFQFLNEEAVSIQDLVMNKIHWWWVVGAVCLFLIANFVDGLRISVAIKKLTGRFRPFLSYKSVACCRFYDSMTPLSTGGQPFQIFYLNKRGLNASSATSVPLIKYILSQGMFILVSVFVLMFNGDMLINMDVRPLIITMCYIGLGLNLLIILAVAMLSTSKKIAPKLMLGILKLLKFLHLIKDVQTSFDKVMKLVHEYIAAFKVCMTSWWLIIVEVFLSLVHIALCGSIAFVVYCIFCDFDASMWFTFFVLQLACDLAISFIPIPGGAGTAEISFSALCRPLFVAALGTSAGGLFVWAILFYRILTYYGYLIQGGLLLLYDFLIGNRKIEAVLGRYNAPIQSRIDDSTRLEEVVAKTRRYRLKADKTKINKNGE